MGNHSPDQKYAKPFGNIAHMLKDKPHGSPKLERKDVDVKQLAIKLEDTLETQKLVQLELTERKNETVNKVVDGCKYEVIVKEINEKTGKETIKRKEKIDLSNFRSNFVNKIVN